MTNLQAALGVAQLEKLEEFIDIKRENYNLYKELFDNIDGMKILDFNNKIRPNYWFYSLLLEDNKFDRDELIKKLGQEKIQTRPIWGLIHEQKPYVSEQCYKIEKARYYHDKIINIPCSTNLTTEDIEYVIRCIKDIINNNI